MTAKYRELEDNKDFGGYVSFDVDYVNATGST